ncbi:MAG TPA: hypothetical protein VHC22_29390 [Pirellulales bacterium]|nr:hypothetical protein [Pirellulales bacterium]
MNLSLRALGVVGSVVRWIVGTASVWTLAGAFSFARADEPEKATPPDPLREIYREDAERCSFSTARGEPLKLANESIMRWSTDDDWSGDVFVWMREKQPEVIGCIMSGPTNDSLRKVVHEFHLLAETPIGPAVVQNGRRWKPAQGLKRERLADAPPPASSAAARLVQMRQIARGFTATMEFDGRWELRLLPQPLLRYGDEQGEAADGALFCYVWPKGTDPELVLLVESRRDDQELAWHFAPVRFTTRELWLSRNGREEWHGEPHQETDRLSTMLYTVDTAREISKPMASR